MTNLFKTFAATLFVMFGTGFFGQFVDQSGPVLARKPIDAGRTQATESAIGKKVVTKYGANLRVEKQNAIPDRTFRVYTVHELSGKMARHLHLALTHRDLRKAIKFAKKACELTNWNKPEPLEALAVAYAGLGDYKSAVQWQRKANALHTDPQKKERGALILKLYLEDKPYHDPALAGRQSAIGQSLLSRGESTRAWQSDGESEGLIS